MCCCGGRSVRVHSVTAPSGADRTVRAYLASTPARNSRFRVLPSLPTFPQLLIGQIYADLLGIGIDCYLITILNESDWPPDPGFGRHMAHHQAVRAAGKSPIGNQAYAISESLADQGRRHGQHLANAGASHWTLAANHHHISGFDPPVLDSSKAGLFAVEHPLRSVSRRCLSPATFATAPSGARFPCNTTKCPDGCIGFSNGFTTDCSCW